MLKLCRVTRVKVFFLVLVYVCNFDLFEFSAAILEKGLLSADSPWTETLYIVYIMFMPSVTNILILWDALNT